MKPINTRPEAWGRLLEATLGIKRMAPWQWLNEDDIFGVQDPQTGEIGFVSVMGALGEHTAVSVYRGPEALAKFLNLQQSAPEILQEYPEALLEIPQLQASFEDRDDLDDRDRQLIRNLGYKPRGRKAWPRFQSYRPGFLPWHLETDEVRTLAQALEQLAQVAPRAREDRFLFISKELNGFLVRACGTEGDAAGKWEDRWIQIPPPEPPQIPLFWDPQDVKQLKKVKSGGEIIELDFFLMPIMIGKKSERPACAYALLALHAQSSLILGAEFFQLTDTLENLWGRIPGNLLSRLANAGIRPKEIRVQNYLLLSVLPPAFDELGTRVVFKPALKKLRAAKREMIAHFEREPAPFQG